MPEAGLEPAIARPERTGELHYSTLAWRPVFSRRPRTGLDAGAGIEPAYHWVRASSLSNLATLQRPGPCYGALCHLYAWYSWRCQRLDLNQRHEGYSPQLYH